MGSVGCFITPLINCYGVALFSHMFHCWWNVDLVVVAESVQDILILSGMLKAVPAENFLGSVSDALDELWTLTGRCANHYTATPSTPSPASSICLLEGQKFRQNRIMPLTLFPRVQCVELFPGSRHCASLSLHIPHHSTLYITYKFPHQYTRCLVFSHKDQNSANADPWKYVYQNFANAEAWKYVYQNSANADPWKYVFFLSAWKNRLVSYNSLFWDFCLIFLHSILEGLILPPLRSFRSAPCLFLWRTLVCLLLLTVTAFLVKFDILICWFFREMTWMCGRVSWRASGIIVHVRVCISLTRLRPVEAQLVCSRVLWLYLWKFHHFDGNKIFVTELLFFYLKKLCEKCITQTAP